MFKSIVERFRPSRPAYIDRISIEYGHILAQGDCESILFFMLPNLQWGDGLNGAILGMAGLELDEYIRHYSRNPHSGEVLAIPPFGTPYKQMYMAILANWDGGNGFEDRDLMNCYRHAITMAQSMGIKNIAIPALGRDKRDFPHIRFARLALKGILEALDNRMERVTIYCVDNRTLQTYQEQLYKLQHGDKA